MKINKINFTKAALDSLLLPDKNKRDYYYDVKVRGLGVSLTPTGTKTFIVYRWFNGKPERITLGRYPDLTIEQARRMAAEVNASVARGDNPNDKRRQERAEITGSPGIPVVCQIKNYQLPSACPRDPGIYQHLWIPREAGPPEFRETQITLGQLFNEYLERHAKFHKKSWKEDQDQFVRYLATWQNQKLSAITKQDVQKLHQNIGKENGTYAANRLLSLLCTLFNKAIEYTLWDKANPTLGIKKFKEKSRDRFLQADELPKFFDSLADEPNIDIRDYVLLSLLTGARRSNVLSMQWANINFDRAEWYIPETKNNEPQIVTLSKEALTILNNRKSNLNTETDYVFPSHGKYGHLTEPKKGWQRILQRAGIDNLRIHDLRRTLGSWQAKTGASLAIIGKSLNHKSQAATAVYARLDYIYQSIRRKGYSGYVRCSRRFKQS